MCVKALRVEARAFRLFSLEIFINRLGRIGQVDNNRSPRVGIQTGRKTRETSRFICEFSILIAIMETSDIRSNKIQMSEDSVSVSGFLTATRSFAGSPEQPLPDTSCTLLCQARQYDLAYQTEMIRAVVKW